MIIGKPLTALGGGGLKPEIIVTAKAGALLNLHYKDSSIILQSYQLGAEETQHTFVVDVSETAYVVEDVTNGKDVEVLVDTVSQYSVEIEYVLWLYKYGDECIDITGGWVNRNIGGTITKNQDNIYMSNQPTGSGSCALDTANVINTTGYTKLCAIFSFSTSGSGTNGRVCLSKDDKYQVDIVKTSNTEKATFETLIGEQTEELKGLMRTYGSDARTTKLNVYAIWLE